MTNVRIEEIAASGKFELLRAYLESTGVITVATTSLANGASRTHSVTFPYTRDGTRADVYAIGDSPKDVKAYVNSGGKASANSVYRYRSTEVATLFIVYGTNDMTVSLTIANNTGAAINPISQTIDITAVFYDAPISAF